MDSVFKHACRRKVCSQEPYKILAIKVPDVMRNVTNQYMINHDGRGKVLVEQETNADM